jgi:hypothetical protein
MEKSNSNNQFFNKIARSQIYLRKGLSKSLPTKDEVNEFVMYMCLRQRSPAGAMYGGLDSILQSVSSLFKCNIKMTKKIFLSMIKKGYIREDFSKKSNSIVYFLIPRKTFFFKLGLGGDTESYVESRIRVNLKKKAESLGSFVALVDYVKSLYVTNDIKENITTQKNLAEQKLAEGKVLVLSTGESVSHSRVRKKKMRQQYLKELQSNFYRDAFYSDINNAYCSKINKPKSYMFDFTLSGEGLASLIGKERTYASKYSKYLESKGLLRIIKNQKVLIDICVGDAVPLSSKYGRFGVIDETKQIYRQIPNSISVCNKFNSLVVGRYVKSMHKKHSVQFY